MWTQRTFNVRSEVPPVHPLSEVCLQGEHLQCLPILLWMYPVSDLKTKSHGYWRITRGLKRRYEWIRSDGNEDLITVMGYRLERRQSCKEVICVVIKSIKRGITDREVYKNHNE